EPGLVEAHLQSLDCARLNIPGAAARARFRQAAAEPGAPGEALPFAAVPAKGARNLAAIFQPNQRRYDLDLQAMRDVERGVVDRLRHGLGEAWIVLGIDLQPALA